MPLPSASSPYIVAGTTTPMTTVRETIAIKAQAGGAQSLTAEEMVDVLKMVHELGRHEAAAIAHKRERAADETERQRLESENAALRQFAAKERRALFDSFAAACLAAGKSVEDAATLADQMLVRREGRK